MYCYSPANNKNLIKAASSLLMENSNVQSRNQTAFDPLNYEFDAETMIEPFTYFHNGPTESRRKINEFSSPLTHFPWLATHHSSVLSSPDENPQNYFSPIITEQFNHILQLKSQSTLPQQPQYQQQQFVYPKTICRHCKSHNMPECLYTSHTMYDETGAIFCPVLKKCHCATCIRVANPNMIRDDDSDDDNTIRLTTNSNESNHFNGIHSGQNSYRMINNNNF